MENAFEIIGTCLEGIYYVVQLALYIFLFWALLKLLKELLKKIKKEEKENGE